MPTFRILSISHTVYVSRIFFLRFGDNKSPQISRTLLRILAEYKIALFCNSIIFSCCQCPRFFFSTVFELLLKLQLWYGWLSIACCKYFLAPRLNLNIFQFCLFPSASLLLYQGTAKSIILHCCFCVSWPCQAFSLQSHGQFALRNATEYGNRCSHGLRLVSYSYHFLSVSNPHR